MPHPSEPGKLHLDYKTHPPFPPKFGVGGASYSPNNTVHILENSRFVPKLKRKGCKTVAQGAGSADRHTV